MPKVQLSQAFCSTARCEDGKRKADFYDTITTGLVLEVRASGNRTFYLRYDQNGRQRQHKIGRFEDITFAAARKVAQRLRSEVVMGGDPAGKRAEARAIPLFADLAAQHVEHARTYMKSIKTLEGYMRRIVARWGRYRLSDIRQQDVATWLAQLRQQGLAPATVEKVRVTMNRTYQLGAEWETAGALPNPVKGVPRPRFSNARERTVTPQEVARLLAAARASRNPQLSAIVSLLLYTGMRLSELLSTRWKDVDLDRRSLFVPTSKSGRSRHIPISIAAMEVIGSIPRRADDVFVFPNPADKSKHLTTVKHGWQTAREAAGMPDLRLHDLRHASASAMVSAGIDLYSVGKILGHSSPVSTARYSHVANSTLLAAVDAGAAKLSIAID